MNAPPTLAIGIQSTAGAARPAAATANQTRPPAT